MERHHDARRDDLRFRGPSSDRLSLLADAHPDPASCTDSPNLLAFSNEMRSPGANPGTESIDSTLMSELALPSSAREASPEAIAALRSRSHSMSAATPTLSDAGGKKATSFDGRTPTPPATKVKGPSPTTTGGLGGSGGSGERRPRKGDAVMVDSVTINNTAFAVQRVWACELPPAPASFSVDVMLTSGLTVVVPHPHRSVDDRWFVIAKDANAKSHLLARFQPLPSHPSHWRAALAKLSAPVFAEACTLLMLLLSAALALGALAPPAAAATDGGLFEGPEATAVDGVTFPDYRRLPPASAWRAAGARVKSAALDAWREWWSREDMFAAGARNLSAWELGGWGDMVPLAGEAVAASARQPATRSAAGAALIATVAAFALARLGGRLSAMFPPQTQYTLMIRAASSEEALAVDGAGGRDGAGAPDAVMAGLGGDREHSSVSVILAAVRACWPPPASPPLKGSPGADGGDGAADGDGAGGAKAPPSPPHGSLPPSPPLGALLEVVEKFCLFGRMFGPLMAIGVRNDEVNVRKAREAWSRHEAAAPHGTAREVLEAEKASGVHRAGGVLADPSAAISLLWMRRSLQFLAAIMRGVADDRKKGDPVSKIAKEAYAEHLEPYHGWLLKNTFAAALSAIPSRNEFLSRLAPAVPPANRERVCYAELRECAAITRELTAALVELYRELDLEDTRRV